MHVAPARSRGITSGSATNANILLLLTTNFLTVLKQPAGPGNRSRTWRPASPHNDSDYARRRVGEKTYSPHQARADLSRALRRVESARTGPGLGNWPMRQPGSQTCRDGGHDRRLTVCSPHVDEAACLALTQDSQPRWRMVLRLPAPGTGRSTRERGTTPRGSGTAPLCRWPREHARLCYLCQARAARDPRAGVMARSRPLGPPPTLHAPPPTSHAPPLAHSSPAWTTDAGSRLCQRLRGRERLRARPTTPWPEKAGRPFPGDTEKLCWGKAVPQTEANVNTGLTRWKFVIKRICNPTA